MDKDEAVAVLRIVDSILARGPGSANCATLRALADAIEQAQVHGKWAKVGARPVWIIPAPRLP